MQHEEILTTIVSTNPDTLLEVALCADRESGQRVELRRLSWGEGVGWYRQQTLRLEATEAEGLLLALRGHRTKWRAQTAEAKGTVIPFPTRTGCQRGHERKTA